MRAHEDESTSGDPLDDVGCRSITLEAISCVVCVAGCGPVVIAMGEMPGIRPHVAHGA